MRFVVVYQREPHAGQLAFADVQQPTSEAERARLARRTLDETKLEVDVWIDDLGDPSRRLFGGLPNWAIVVDPAGAVRLKLPWFVPEVVDQAVAEVAGERRGAEAAPPLSATRCLEAIVGPAPASADDTERRRARHHRDAMLAHLVDAAPGHGDRERWLAELARDTAPAAQRRWVDRLPPTIPAGEDPQRWAADMRRFEAMDRDAPAPAGGVVFVGSSSIRRWSSLAEDMAGLPVVQRGFGGSRLFDACYWSDVLVTRHRPAAVVLFSGTNDLAGDDPKSAEHVRDLFRLFVRRVRRADPDLSVAWIAITPTPARARHLALVREANRLVRAECEADPRLAFLDPTADLTRPDGTPDPAFFVDDGLHLNADGYAVWTRHVRAVVARLHAGRNAPESATRR